MAEFKWTKGTPKESGEYLITFKEEYGDEYWVTTDTYNKIQEEWSFYLNSEVIAYAPLPKPFRPRRRKKK